LLSVLNIYDPVSTSTILVIAALVIIGLLFLNRDLYGFFLSKRGVAFTLKVIPLHFLYYFYCGASFGICWMQDKLGLLKTTQSNS